MTTTQSNEPERRKSPVLILIWVSVIVSHIALAGLIYQSLVYSRESGYQNRAIEDLTSDTDTLREEVEVWRVYVETLRTAMVSRGLEVPDIPELAPLSKPGRKRG